MEGNQNHLQHFSVMPIAKGFQELVFIDGDL
jgi:hypothetical protein